MDNVALLINSIAANKEFILLVLFVTMLATFYFSFRIKTYNIEENKRDLVGVFFLLSGKQIAQIVFSFLTLMYIISTIIRFAPVEITHVYLYLSLVFMSIILNINKLNVFVIAINRLLQGSAIIVLSIVVNYTQNIRFDYRFLLIYIVGAIAVILYSIYIFVVELQDVSKGRVIKDES